MFLIATSSYSYPADQSFGNPLTDWDKGVNYNVIKNGGYAYETEVTDPATGQQVTRVYNSKTPWSDEDSAKLSKSLANANNEYTLLLAGEPEQPPEEPKDTTPLTSEEQRRYDFLVKNLMPVDNTQKSDDANNGVEQQSTSEESSSTSTSTDPYYGRPSADRQRPTYDTDYNTRPNSYGRQQTSAKAASVHIPSYNSWYSSRPSPNQNAYPFNYASSRTRYPSKEPASPSAAATTTPPSWYYRNQQR